MTQEDDKQSRRKFIKRSAGVIGAMGVAVVATPNEAKAACLTDPNDTNPQRPELEYPWRVGVDPRGKLSLLLLRDSIPSIHAMVYRMSFRAVLENMREQFQLMTSVTDPSPERDCIVAALGTYDINDLNVALNDSIDALLSNGITYIDLASIPQSNWPPNLAVRLAVLDEIISIPIVHVDPVEISTFRNTNPDGPNFERYSAHRTIQALFCSRAGYINQRPDELVAFRRARDVGLLWCTPRTEGPARIVVTNNDRQCDDDVNGNPICADNRPNHYCQLVDGQCSAMST